MSTWKVKREIVNGDTQLSKVTAVRTDTESGDVRAFAYKGRFSTAEEIAAAWDNIWNQYTEARTKAEYVDPVAAAGQDNLQAREA